MKDMIDDMIINLLLGLGILIGAATITVSTVITPTWFKYVMLLLEFGGVVWIIVLIKFLMNLFKTHNNNEKTKAGDKIGRCSLCGYIDCMSPNSVLSDDGKVSLYDCVECWSKSVYVEGCPVPILGLGKNNE